LHRLRRLAAIFLVTTLALLPTVAGAGTKTGEKKEIKYRRASESRGVFTGRVVTTAGRRVTTTQSHFSCRNWSTIVIVETTESSTDPVTKKVTVVSVKTPETHYWRQCKNLVTGVLGPEREVPLGSPGGDESYTVDVPKPKIYKSGEFFTQRLGYFWVPPKYYTGFYVPVILGGKATPGVTAFARAEYIELYPGYGPPSKSIDCTNGAAHPLDLSTDYFEQQNDCALIYYQPSRVQTDGTYKVTMLVYWTVDVDFPGELFDKTIPLESRSEMNLDVRELQSIVVCESNDPNGCRGTK
jgi:hypothetical protein